MTDRSDSLLLSTQSPPTRPRRKQAPSLLRRIRRNRFWLLLYLWLTLALPGLVLCSNCGFSSMNWTVPLFALAPAITLFILCTAMPQPQTNYALSLICSAVAFLFHGIQLLYHRLFGQFITLRTLTEPVRIYRFHEALRVALLDSLGQLLVMAIPLALLMTVGRKLFSFRPLKRWQQHIPMGCACILSHLLVILCLPLVKHPETPVLLLIPEPPATESVPFQSAEPMILSRDDTPNRLDLDFSVGEESESVASIHRYFAGRSPSGRNAQTGLFRDCNLIQISADVSGPPDITGEQAPTLHRMTREGLLLTDYHAPGWNIFPFDREFAQLTGIVPSGGSASLETAANNFMPLTMVQQLIPQGYRVWGLHCCEEEACIGSRYLEALGYECTVSSLPPRDAFDRWIGTFTEHTPFSVFSFFDSACGLSQLDETLTLLLSRLDSTGNLKNTVIVLSLTFEDGTGLCILWKPGLHPETVEAPSGALDLLPTLSNLFGLEFDSRLYMGRDVFSDAAPLVILPDGSWITERTMYDALSGKTINRTEELLEDGYIHEISREVRRRTEISARVLQEDYWAHLFP